MSPGTYLEYLELWIKFLNELINKDDIEDGSKRKYEKQRDVVSDARHAAPLNIELFNLFSDVYNGVAHLNSSLNSNNDLDISKPQQYFIDYFNTNPNGSSTEAIDKALTSKNLFLVQGPPGTGKTSVIAEITAQFIKNNPSSRVAIASETHIAVDNALERIIDIIEDEHLKILRYPKFKYAQSNFNEHEFKTYVQEYEAHLTKNYKIISKEIFALLELEELSVDFQNETDDHRLSGKWIHKLILEKVSIVGITCNQMSRFRLELGDKPWDLVIIDEVSKATLPEIFLAAQNAKKIILVGDPKQLPPVFCREEIEVAEALNLDADILKNDSLVDRLYESCPENMKAFLNTQYRMTDEIGTLVSEQFYPGEGLTNGRNESKTDSLQWLDYTPKTLVGQKPISQGGKLRNIEEASLIVDELKKIKIKFSSDISIAIITPYKDQKKHLISVLKESYFKNIEIDTVDAFQGRQAKIVFFSVSRNCGSTRFFSDPRRLNVALSRSIDHFYLVGSYDYLKKIQFFRSLKVACSL